MPNFSIFKKLLFNTKFINITLIFKNLILVRNVNKKNKIEEHTVYHLSFIFSWACMLMFFFSILYYPYRFMDDRIKSSKRIRFVLVPKALIVLLFQELGFDFSIVDIKDWMLLLIFFCFRYRCHFQVKVEFEDVKETSKIFIDCSVAADCQIRI